MRLKYLIIIALFLMPIIAVCNSENSTDELSNKIDTRSLAIINAHIYTVDKDHSFAEAVLVKNGVITKVGTTAEITQELASSTKVVDLKGRFVMPGFQDAHLHVAEAGFNEIMCIFEESQNTIADYEDSFLDCADDPAPWILGSGIAVSDMIEDTTQSPRQFLDVLFPETPVLVLDNLGHGAWANSLAMTLADFDPLKPAQPQGGIILTDESGQATGELFENAQQKLRDIAFTAVDPDQSLSYEGLLKGLSTVAENGITSVSDAGGYWTRNDHLLWARAEQEGRMTTRAFNALYVFPDRETQQQIIDINALYSVSENSLVSFSFVKIYVDGILSLGTASLNRPYLSPVVEALDYPLGFTYFRTDDLNTYVSEFEKKGFQMHFHVTGDQGAKLALDAIAHAKEINGSLDKRHRLTHLYQVDTKDYHRFKTLGVTADFQLNPGSLDKQYNAFLQEVLGQERAGNVLPVKSLIDAGANVILSSDYDAGPLSPLGTIARALDRPDNSSQSVPDIATAIEMMTINVAYHFHQEDRTGSISVGKRADMIVLDKNITAIPTKEIASTKVLSTLLDGKVVYDRLGLF